MNSRMHPGRAIGAACAVLMSATAAMTQPANPHGTTRKTATSILDYGPPMSAHPASPRGKEIGPPAPTQPPVATGPPCQARLAAQGATFQAGTGKAVLQTGCPIVDPVQLQSVRVLRGNGADVIRLSAPPLLACETALAVTEWVQDSIAPLVRGHFDEALIEIGVGGGYECRTRNHQAQAPRSEHSYGRALDLMNFRTAKRSIAVEKSPAADAKRFLDAVWASACGHFATALGPEADAFHATHIHVDQQPRKSASSKFCE